MMIGWLSLHRRSALIFIITIIGYGLLLPWMGFYWDDWPFAWFAEFLGPAEFLPAFQPYRPFLGPIFYITTSLIPPVPIYWQIFALVIRLLIGLTAWWTFKQIFPNQHRLPYILGILMLVFPGYSQHWVAFTHINQELIPFIFLLLSFGFTFKGLHSKNPYPYIILAILFQICGIFPTEYFMGLEALRFLLLMYHFEGGTMERIGRAFRAWLPYLVVWILNALWLIFYYKYGPYHSYNVVVTDSSFVDLVIQFLDGILKAGFYVWWRILVLLISSITSTVSILTIGLMVISFLFLGWSYFRFERQEDHEDFSLHRRLLFLGFSGLLLGRLPSVMAGLPLKLDSSADRLMISMALGGCLFLAGIIEGVTKNLRTKNVLYMLAISFAIGQQFYNSNIFRRDWEKQANIYWQLAWRIPGLKPDTVLLTNELQLDYESDLSITAQINWMYAPEYTRSNLPYILLYTTKRLGGPTLPSLSPGVRISYPFRTIDFVGTTSKMVVIYMPPNGCLRVLQSDHGDELIYPNLPGKLTEAIPLSDPSRIITHPDTPARPLFVDEPAHGWCYYYARAELARQEMNYLQVVALGDEAISLGLKPADRAEWMVFIESYAITGDLDTARQLSYSALTSSEQVRREICTVWRLLLDKDLVDDQAQLLEIINSLNCER